MINEETEIEQVEMSGEVEATDEVMEAGELDDFESAEIEENIEFLVSEQVLSILESVLFATDKPQSVAVLKQAFKGTNIKTPEIKKALEKLQIEYAGGTRGVVLEEIKGGYQLRTKVDNMTYIKRMLKGRSFRLSGAALEVLSIVAYNQPCIKVQVDEIRGVESGHLLRGLMDRGMMKFAGKSELPGKPMLYETTSKFLEIFGLRNISELPSLSEIDDLIPEGIGAEEEKEERLEDITGDLSKDGLKTYSESEDELEKIVGTLEGIDTSSEFFEAEKQRMKDKREAEKAQDIREALEIGEEVSTRDKNWLERYDLKMAEQAQTEEIREEDTAEGESLSEEDQVESEVELEFSESEKSFEKENAESAPEPDLGL